MLRKVYVMIEETAIYGIFSSKRKAYQWYADANKMTLAEAEAKFHKPSGGYPALEEVEVDGEWNMDR